MDKRELLTRFIDSNREETNKNYETIRKLFAVSLTDDIRSALTTKQLFQFIDLQSDIIKLLIKSDHEERSKLIDIAYTKDNDMVNSL